MGPKASSGKSMSTSSAVPTSASMPANLLIVSPLLLLSSPAVAFNLLFPLDADGVKMKIWQCFDDLAQQTWNPLSTGQIQLAGTNFCLDLTNGVTTNQNVLQIWTCTSPDVNQLWNIKNAFPASS